MIFLTHSIIPLPKGLPFEVSIIGFDEFKACAQVASSFITELKTGRPTCFPATSGVIG